jgi:hypothetical protein
MVKIVFIVVFLVKFVVSANYIFVNLYEYLIRNELNASELSKFLPFLKVRTDGLQKRDLELGPISNLFTLPNGQLQVVQNAALSKINRYRSFYGSKRLSLDSNLVVKAGQRALQIANRNYALFNGESVFIACRSPRFGSYSGWVNFKRFENKLSVPFFF